MINTTLFATPQKTKSGLAYFIGSGNGIESKDGLLLFFSCKNILEKHNKLVGEICPGAKLFAKKNTVRDCNDYYLTHCNNPNLVRVFLALGYCPPVSLLMNISQNDTANWTEKENLECASAINEAIRKLAEANDLYIGR